jgi:hypothetical protein
LPIGQRQWVFKDREAPTFASSEESAFGVAQEVQQAPGELQVTTRLTALRPFMNFGLARAIRLPVARVEGAQLQFAGSLASPVSLEAGEAVEGAGDRTLGAAWAKGVRVRVNGQPVLDLLGGGTRYWSVGAEDEYFVVYEWLMGDRPLMNWPIEVAAGSAYDYTLTCRWGTD